MEKVIGIVGGMGPMATVELFRMIVQHTDSVTDQGHARIIIDNNTYIADRTKAILTGSKEPIIDIIHSAEGIISLGADFLLIPCNTSHFFFDEIQANVSKEILNMVAETAKEVQCLGLKKVGLLATTGTIKGKLYHQYLEDLGVEVVSLNEKMQNDVMDFIYSGVKASNNKYDTKAFSEAVESMLHNGAQKIILGCTEIPVGMKMYDLHFPYIDSLEVLAKAAVIKSGHKYK